MRPWTPEEDAALTAAVHKYGACRWSMIATSLSTGRVGKQCRERWNNHLCPEVKKSEWSEEEDRAIMHGVALLSTRWCEIVKAPELAGRTDNSIKNRFYALERKMRNQHGNRARRPIGQEQCADDDKAAPELMQTDRVMGIARELAFTTDEIERDRLIEQLTAALHEPDPNEDGATNLGSIDLSNAKNLMGNASVETALTRDLCAEDVLEVSSDLLNDAEVGEIKTTPSQQRVRTLPSRTRPLSLACDTLVVNTDNDSLPDLADDSETASTASPRGSESSRTMLDETPWMLSNASEPPSRRNSLEVPPLETID